jgi:hypothetical protein
MSEIPPPPPAPMAAGGTASGPKNWMGLVSLILGIVSLVFACCWGGGFLFGVGAVVLGVLGGNAAKAGEATNAGQAKAGLITGIIGVVLSVLAWIAIFAFSFVPTDFSSYS